MHLAKNDNGPMKSSNKTVILHVYVDTATVHMFLYMAKISSGNAYILQRKIQTHLYKGIQFPYPCA